MKSRLFLLIHSKKSNKKEAPVRSDARMNYKHLHYFWHVAKLGGVLRASEHLHLSPQTISGQIQRLEKDLGAPLFAKQGRGLVLTDAGRTALGYAEAIFSMGAELTDAIRGRPAVRERLVFRVGVADTVPKSVAGRLLEPALHLPEPVRIVCREWKLETLLGELAQHRMDLVITDAPAPPGLNGRLFNHRLGRCGLAFFGTPALAEQHAGPFPACLQGAPLILPAPESALGQRLRDWLRANQLVPQVVAECDDSALAKELGRRGLGLFVGPRLLAREIEQQYRVRTLAETQAVEEEFYVLSGERRITHPCVQAITQAARTELFASPRRRRVSRA